MVRNEVLYCCERLIRHPSDRKCKVVGTDT